MFTFSSIKGKLFALVMTLSGAMLVIGGIGLWGTWHCNTGMHKMYKNNLEPLVHITTVRASINSILREIAFAAIHDPANPVSALHDHPVDIHIASIEKNLDEISQQWKAYSQTIDSPEEKQLASTLNATKEEFIQRTVVPSLDFLKKQNYAAANLLVFKGGTAQAKKAAQDAQNLLDYQLKQSEKQYQKSQVAFQKVEVMFAISICVGLGMALLIGYFISRSITGSAACLVSAAARIEDGDFTARCNINGKDEMAVIASSFDRIAQSFTQTINELSSIASEVTAAASTVHQSSEEVAHGAEQVASEAATVATAGEEMASTSGDIARNCQLAAESSHEATEQATGGAAIIQSSIRVMEKIAEQVSSTAHTVELLGQRSDQIGEIVGTIEDIADQTNLLALNAAIEAARAGEMGRGFAVVADEVRALAERTTKATREIAQMIKSIQQDTRTAVTAMEAGVAQVQEGSHEAERSGDAIEGILSQINNLSLQISQIATAAEEQTATTSEISSNMLRITDTVSSSSQSATASAVEASHLNDLADSLMETLSKFTIDEPVHLSLKKAKSAHMIFTGKIRAHLSGALQLDPQRISTHLTCPFGKWCLGRGKELVGHLPIFREIEAPHTLVHDLGKQAVVAYNAGDRQKAQSCCDEMMVQSAKLMSILDRMMA